LTEEPSCSRCGSTANLALVTIRYIEGEGPGRVLVYCPSCRTDFADSIGVTIPLGSLTSEAFLDLYRTKKTSSDPDIAVQIVFGEERPELISEASRLLRETR
jgi:hypothetical protein